MNIQAIEINSTEDIILIEFNEDSSYDDISTVLDCIKKTFPQEEIQVLDIVPEPTLEIEQFEPEKMVREHKLTPREKQMNKPMFDSDFEKYEWLMNNGCTNPEDRKWLADYIRSNEYNNLYGG